MSIVAENLPLPRRGDYQKKLPRRCRDGIRKNVLVFKAVTGLD